MFTEGATVPNDEARKGFGQFVLRFRVSGVAGFLLLLGLAFTLLRPQFITPGNLSAIISNAAILAIVAAAQAVVLITRNLDVSVGSIMGFSAYLTADFAARHPDAGPLLMLMPLAIGAALGALNGLLVAYGRVSPLIATLGTMSVYRGLTYVYARGQEITSSRLPTWMNALPEARIAGVPLLVVIAFIVVCLLAAFLRLSLGETHVRRRVERLGERIRQGRLNIRGVPTSQETARIAKQYGVPLTSLDEVDELTITVDGADEVDPEVEAMKEVERDRDDRQQR